MLKKKLLSGNSFISTWELWMAKIKMSNFCISALHQRWNLGNPNTQTHDISKNKDGDNFACWIILQSLSSACLDLRCWGRMFTKLEQEQCFHFLEKCLKTLQTCSPSSREQHSSSQPKKKEQEIPLTSRLLGGARKGTAFINNKFHLMGENHKVLT